MWIICSAVLLRYDVTVPQFVCHIFHALVLLFCQHNNIPHKREEVQHFLKINSGFFHRAFSLTTAPHFLRVKRRHLTIALMYSIITAEKEFMWSRIFDFLIASISHRNGLDHSFDHLRLWTTWKQCEREHPKAPISD